MRSRPLWILVVLGLTAAPALAEPYRCQHPDGSIAFQDTPCPPGTREGRARQEQRRSTSAPAAPDPRTSTAPRPGGVVTARIPSVGTAHVPTLEGWRAEVVQPGEDVPPTVRLSSPDPGDPATVLLTFIPNRDGRRLDAREFVETARRLLSRHLADSVEQEVDMQVLDTQLGQSVYASFTDRSLQHVASPPPGTFRNVTAGLIWHSRVIVNYTILTNGLDRDSRLAGLTMVSSFVVSSDSPAAAR